VGSNRKNRYFLRRSAAASSMQAEIAGEVPINVGGALGLLPRLHVVVYAAG